MLEKFEDLLGKTLTGIDKEVGELVFTLDTGEKYKLYHSQDCCESVTIEDIIGDLNDLVDSPILMAEEAISQDTPLISVKDLKIVLLGLFIS